MQVSGGFLVSADWSWLVLVGALVGDCLASDDAPWLAIVNRAAAWSGSMSSRSVGNSPRPGSASSPLNRGYSALKGTASLTTMLNTQALA